MYNPTIKIRSEKWQLAIKRQSKVWVWINPQRFRSNYGAAPRSHSNALMTPSDGTKPKLQFGTQSITHNTIHTLDPTISENRNLFV